MVKAPEPRIEDLEGALASGPPKAAGKAGVVDNRFTGPRPAMGGNDLQTAAEQELDTRYRQLTGTGKASPFQKVDTSNAMKGVVQEHELAKVGLRAMEDEYEELQAKQRDAYADQGAAPFRKGIDDKLDELSRRINDTRAVLAEGKGITDKEVSRAIEKELSGDIGHLTQSRSGFVEPDPAGVSEAAQRIADQYGDPGDDFYMTIRNRLSEGVAGKANEKAALENYRKMAAPIMERMQARGDSAISSYQAEFARSQASIDSIRKVLGKDMDRELTMLSQAFSERISAMDDGLQEQKDALGDYYNALTGAVESGSMDEAAAREAWQQRSADYNDLVDDRNKQAGQVQAGYEAEANKLQSRYNDMFYRRQRDILGDVEQRMSQAQEAYNKAAQASPQDAEELRKLYAQAWDKTMKDRTNAVGAVDKAHYDAISTASPGAAFTMWFGKSLVSGLGGAVKRTSVTIGSRDGYTLGEEMEQAFLRSEPDTKKLSDLLDGRNLAGVSGQLAGGMLPSLVAAGTVSAATGGLGAGAGVQLLASGAAGFLTESVDIAGGVRDQVYRNTGDPRKADEAANAAWVSQLQLLPAYAFEGLPFVGKALHGIGSRGARMGVGGLVEYTTELFQELPQNIAEDNIVNGRAAWDGFGKALMGPQTKETMIQMVPLMALGAAGHITGGPQEELERAAKAYMAKSSVAQKSQGLVAQWMQAMVDAQGEKFADAVITSLYASGNISDKEALHLSLVRQQVSSDMADADQVGLGKKDARVYASFRAKANDYERMSAQADSDPVKGHFADKAKALNAEAASFLANKEGSYVTVEYADGTSSTLSVDEAKSLFSDPDFIAKAALLDEDIRFDGHGKEGTGLLDEFYAKVERAHDAQAAFALDPVNAQLTVVEKKQKLQEDVEEAISEPERPSSTAGDKKKSPVTAEQPGEEVVEEASSPSDGTAPDSKAAARRERLRQLAARIPKEDDPATGQDQTTREAMQVAGQAAGNIPGQQAREALAGTPSSPSIENTEGTNGTAAQVPDQGSMAVTPPVAAPDTEQERQLDDALLGGQAAENRRAGRRTIAGQEYRRQSPQDVPEGSGGRVQFSDGVEADFEYVVMEADAVQPSHADGRRNPVHFIPEAQPKPRTDKESQLAAGRIAAAPDLNKVGASPNAYSGAPVVNARGEVVQGNNRASGLKEHYKQGGTAYKEALAANAAQFGLDPEQVRGMENPVLVRRISVPDARAIELGNYDAKDIETGGRRGIDPVATAARIPSAVKGRIAERLFARDGDTTLKGAVRDSYPDLVKMLEPYLNPAQRTTLYKAGTNEPSARGVQELEALVKHFLFDGGPSELAEVFEALPHHAQAGITAAMPQLFTSPESMAIVGEVQKGIIGAAEFRASGVENFDAWTAQADAFGPSAHDRYSPTEIAIAKLLAEAKTTKAVREKLNQYAGATKPVEATMFDQAREGMTRQQAAESVFGIPSGRDVDQGASRGIGQTAQHGDVGGAPRQEVGTTPSGGSTGDLLAGLLAPDGGFDPGKLSELREAAAGIERGIQEAERLDRAEEQGRKEGGRRNVEASLLAAAVRRVHGFDLLDGQPSTSARGDTGSEAGVRAQVREAQERVLRAYAQADGSWYTPERIAQETARPLRPGTEADVYLSKDGKSVLKVVHPWRFSLDALRFLDDRISLHNKLFPDTKYELAGFSERDGKFAFVLKQPYIDGARLQDLYLPLAEEKGAEAAFADLDGRIFEALKEAGFDQYAGGVFGSPQYNLHDQHFKNVLVGHDGRLYFIDTVLTLNTPAEGRGGTREYKPMTVREAGQEQAPGLNLAEGVNEAQDDQATEDTPSLETIEGGNVYFTTDGMQTAPFPERVTKAKKQQAYRLWLKGNVEKVAGRRGDQHTLRRMSDPGYGGPMATLSEWTPRHEQEAWDYLFRQGPAATGTYTPTDNPATDWRGSEREGYTPTPRQQAVIGAVEQAMGEGIFSGPDMRASVARQLGLPDADGPGFGMDVHYAERYLDAKGRRDTGEDDRRKLDPKIGDQYGTLVFADGETITDATVRAVGKTGPGMEVVGRKGRKKVAVQTTAGAVMQAMERAKEGGPAAPETPKAAEAPRMDPGTGNIIEDFGEKLAGARKDMPRSLKEDLDGDKLLSLPLGKLWPVDAHLDIADPAVAAFAFTARAEIPAKPRTPWKAARWAEKVKALHDVVRAMPDGVTVERMESTESGRWIAAAYPGFFAKMRLLEQLPRDTWKRVGRVREYPDARAVKTDEELKAEGITPELVDGIKVLYRQDPATGERTPVPYESGARYRPFPHLTVEVDGKNHRLEGPGRFGPDEARQVEGMLGTATPKKGGLTRDDFDLRSRRSDGAAFINRKGDKEYRVLKEFTGPDAVKQAREWMKDPANLKALENEWENVKARDNVSKADTRREENRERVGENRRDGKDVTEQMFTDAFGFRGVQFGLWVGQGKGGKERQGLLNEAYDALLDLADILGIPSQAISLNGSLGLALGARGKGSASAHFEPGNLVINLTKTRGAGTLAHEWFHALDNYFARERGGEVPMAKGLNAQEAYRRANYITYRPEPVYVHGVSERLGTRTAAQLRTELQRRGEWDPSRTDRENFAEAGWKPDPKHPQGVRPEVERAFAELVDALNGSPMSHRVRALDKGPDGYWSRVIERGARTFENYVIGKMAQRGWTNDFLANVRDWDQWAERGKNKDRYPYLFPDEEAPVAAAFDNLFATVQARRTEKGTALFQRPDGTAPLPPTSGITHVDNVLQALSELAPGVTVTLHDDRKGLRDAAKALGIDAGKGVAFADMATNQIHINKEAARDNTLFHEAAHPVLRAVVANNPELLHGLYDQMKDLPGFDKYRRFGRQYAPDQHRAAEVTDLMKEEAVVEYMADLASGKARQSALPQSLYQKFKAWLKDLLAKLGFKPGRMTLDPTDVKKFAEGFAKAVVEGRTIRTPQGAGVQATPMAAYLQAAAKDYGITVAEAKRQYDDVVARYTRPDGAKMPGWMKDPDGSDTKLTELQWVQTRTPAFKNWFGDWEAGVKQRVLNGDPVARLRVEDAPKGGYSEVQKWAAGIFKEQGGKAMNPEIGDVVLDARAAKDSMAHGGANNAKKVAFAAVKDVIENGVVVHRAEGPLGNSIYISAPVDISGSPNIVTVLVRQDPNTQRMYLHAVTLKENLLTPRVSAAATGKASTGLHGSTKSGDVAKVLHDLLTHDPSTVSKVVDGNGVPMPVYHGTNGNFDGFAPNEALGGGMFFSPDPREASAFANARGANVMPVFLSVKNLRQGVVRSYDEVRAIGRAKERGQDGLRVNDAPDGVVNWVVFHPNQIKSATGNTGQFSGKDNVYEQRQEVNDLVDMLIQDNITTPEAIAGELNEIGRPDLVKDIQAAVKERMAQPPGGPSPAPVNELRQRTGEQATPPAEVASSSTAIKNPGRIQVDPLPGTVRNRAEVMKDLQKGTGRTIRFAKPSGRAAGSYLPGSAGVKIRYAGDLDVTAHEIGHALDDQYGLTTRAMADPAASMEMATLSAFGSKPTKQAKDPVKYKAQEGMAEYIRARVVNPGEASRSFPALTALYDQHVGEQAKEVMAAFSNDVRAWAAATAADKIMSNVDMDPRESKSPILKQLFNNGDDVALGWAGKLNANWVDPLHAVEKAMEYLKKEGGVSELKPSRDPYMLARIFLHNSGKTNEVLSSGMITATNQVIHDENGRAKDLNWLLEPFDSSTQMDMAKDMEDTVSYMIAERTLELQGKLGRDDLLTGIGAGIFTDVDVARQALNEMAQDKERIARIQEAARRYREMATHVLEYLRDKGRISQEQFDKITGTNLQYVALQRVIEAGPDQQVEVFRSGGGSRLASVAKPVHTIKGSSRRIKNPYDSLLDSISKGIKEADRNEVLQAFTELMRSGRDMHEGDVQNIAKVGVPGAPGDKNSITVFNDGKPETWLLQEDVYKALKGLDNEGYQVPYLATVPAKVLRWSVTNFPVFALRNIARDLQSRGILTTEGSSLRDLVGNKEHWHEVARAGGLNAGYYLKDDVHYYGLMQEAMARMAKDKRFILADPFRLSKLWKGYENMLYNSETLNRVAEYRAAFRKAKREGMNDYDAQLYAAFRSADLIDFALAGHHARVVNQVVPFFNAQVQGIRSGYRHAKRDPGGFAVRMVLNSILPSIALRMLVSAMGDDDEYEALPAYQRDMFYNVKVGPDQWLSFPKPFELGIPGSFAERLMSYGRGNKEAFDGFSGSALQAFMPVDESAMAGPLRTGVELMTNYDFFRDKPLVPPYEESLALELRNTEGASRIGQLIQKAAGMDARKADHLIRSSFSYYGNFALRLGDIDREDGRNQFDMTDLGFFKHSPAYNSAVVTDLTRFATEYGLTSTREFKAFRKIADAYFDAKDAAAKDAAAKNLRLAAKNIRAALEEQKEVNAIFREAKKEATAK